MDVSPEIQNKLDQVAKLSSGVRIAVVLVVCTVIAAGYYFTVFEGKNAQLTELRAQELELQRKLSEVRSIAANITAFEAEIAELEIELAAALRQLPNQKQLEVLLADISNLGKTAGVQIRSFQREREVVHDFYAEVPLKIELDGTFHEIARFFDLVSKLPRIVNMGALDMKIGSETEQETELTVNGVATTFRFVGQG